jgi:hypothetical protein
MPKPLKPNIQKDSNVDYRAGAKAQPKPVIKK